MQNDFLSKDTRNKSNAMAIFPKEFTFKLLAFILCSYDSIIDSTRFILVNSNHFSIPKSNYIGSLNVVSFIRCDLL